MEKLYCKNCGIDLSGMRGKEFCSRKCSQTGKFNSFYGKKHTKKIRLYWNKKRSGKGNSCYGRCGNLHPFFGKHRSNKVRKAQSIGAKKMWAKRKGIPIEDLNKNKTKFKQYKDLVCKLTNNQPIKLLENFNKRGPAGKIGAYHLDHIYSIFKGFKNKISPKKIAHISNLKMIPWLENDKKGWK
ncbi:MAG: NUMOD3 domain-containing DNA-binding protein [Clostridia bacterium]